MLNKNFLLGCVIATLTACGGQGSLDLGPNNSQYGATPSPTPEPPTTEKTWTWNFEEDPQLESWVTWTEAAQNAGDCNLETSLSLHWQTSALQIAPAEGWQEDFEQLCAFGYVDEPVDMAGGSFYMSVYLPSFFTDQNPWNTDADDGPEDDRFNFGIQVMIEDAEGNRGEAAAWLNVYDLLGSSFNAEGFGRQQRKEDPVAGDVAGRWFDMRFNAENATGAANINEIVGIGLMVTIRDTNLSLAGNDVFGNEKYVFVDNVLLEPNPDYVPPPFVAPSKDPVDFALPVFVNGIASGFSDTWSGWGGTYDFTGASIEAAFGGDGGLQIGGPNPPLDVNSYTTFHMSIYGPEGSGTQPVEISLCDSCDGASIEVNVEGGQWNDFAIPVADFTDTSLAAILVQYRGPDAMTFYIDNVGFDQLAEDINGPLPLTRGWEVQGDGLSVRYGSVSYSPTADNDALYYLIDGPVDMSGATVTFDIIADQAYIDSGANMQPYIQEDFGESQGHWSCWINNADLDPAGMQYECIVGEGFQAAEGEQIKVGVIAKPGSGPIEGSVTITNITVALVGDGADPAIPLTMGWEVQGGDLSVSYGDRVAYSPTADNHALYYLVDGPVDMSGATVIFDIVADQAYIDSGANLQPYVQENFGDSQGHWSCWVNNADLDPAGIQYECVIGEGFEVADGEQIKVGVIAKPGDGPIEGSVTIVDVRYILP